MLPEIFTSDLDGTIQHWEHQRRPEILRMFEEYVYGVTPREPVDQCIGRVTKEETILKGAVIKQNLLLTLKKENEECSFHSRFYLPADGDNGTRRPVVIMINPFSKNASVQYPGRDHDHMPYDLITSRGYIAVHADVDELCLDDSQRYRSGLMDLYPQNAAGSWGAIGVWAFAVSRLIDYMITRTDIDASRIAVCGCSRAGKTALWCAAQDPRISLVISNVSGCTGAAVTRGKTGEHIRDITTEFPHWLCSRYCDYAENEENLPVDQHMLLALCAPRPLYVSSASEDWWADPEKEFESCRLVEPVYRLYGRTGLCADCMPFTNTPVCGNYIGYHNREGVHGCRVYDWEQYLDFMNRHFNPEG